MALPTIARKPESVLATPSGAGPIDPPPRRVEPAEPVGAGVVTPAPHIVQRNENFWTISRKYYGTGRYYKALWAANRQKVAAVDELYVGTSIIIPPEESLDRSLIEPPSSSRSKSQLRRTSASVRTQDGANAPSRSRSEVLVDLPANGDTRGDGLDQPSNDDVTASRSARRRADLPQYRVRANDTLRNIARSRLDDATRAREIADLNEGVIRYDSSGNLIPGQILRLPEDARPMRDN